MAAAPPADDVTTDLGKLKIQVDRISSWFGIAAENGLFIGYHDKFKEILNLLKTARENLKPNTLSICEDNLIMAVKNFSDVLRLPEHRKWRFYNFYAADIWIYLVLFLAAIFFGYYYDINTMLVEKLDIPSTAINAAIWGAIGGILRGIWHLWIHLNDRTFRRSWRIWFFSCPFLGGIFGSLLYLLIVGGLLVLSQDSTPLTSPAGNQTTSTTVNTSNLDTNQTGNAVGNGGNISSQLVVIAFSALAGYNWEWAVKRLEKIGEMV
jgi:hypothetical protein